MLPGFETGRIGRQVRPVSPSTEPSLTAPLEMPVAVGSRLPVAVCRPASRLATTERSLRQSSAMRNVRR